MKTKSSSDTAAVVIGRNEGDRLKRCLRSVLAQVDTLVYVDSGSTDGSVEFAQSLNLEVEQLDMTIPFSAGRARNEGFARVRRLLPETEYVQFVDGDCELCHGWISRGLDFLRANTDYGVVVGHLRERSPEQSIYNQLCNMEWATPPGESQSCGGIFMVRVNAFTAVGGFNTVMVAGEEPELCYRLRKRGWRIFRLDIPMALHDAEILRFSQWWKRALRSGYAYAHEYSLHKHDGCGYRRLEIWRTWFWTIAVPVFGLFGMALIGPPSLLVFAAYPCQLFRVFFIMRKRTQSLSQALHYASFHLIGKWAQLAGQLVFLRRGPWRTKLRIIEYK